MMSRLAAALLLFTVAPGVPAGDFAAFAPGAASEPARHAFSGRLRIDASIASATAVHSDWFDSFGSVPEFELPALDAAVVASDGELLPAERLPVERGAGAWDYLLLPGRSWHDASSGLDRAGLPFALFERNANCLHYGVFAFAWDADGLRGDVRWQIASETCAYLKFDASGVAAAHSAPLRSVSPEDVRSARSAERSRRLPRYPLAALATDYPGADPDAFGSAAEVPPEHMTAHGFVIDQRHYASACATRAGPYPYCEELPLPSYSLAKSLFAGLGLMRAEFVARGTRRAKLADYVRECAGERWQGVTFEHALDMATGNYDDPGYEVDEDGLLSSRFFLAEDHASKIDEACGRFPRREAPGRRWVYHTTDTYVLGTALTEWLRERPGTTGDTYADLVVRPLWQPLGLSPLSRYTRRTLDERQQPFTGWGLVFLADDIARIAAWLGPQRAAIGGEPVLDASLYEAAMQRRDDDRGLPTGVERLRYNNGFWAYDAGPALGCRDAAWVPVMSGFGGIIVALFPNDTAYYYVSDGGTHRWLTAAAASHRLRPMCDTADKDDLHD